MKKENFNILFDFEKFQPLFISKNKIKIKIYKKKNENETILHKI